MNINIRPGHYVVAVSGGVDSVALLDLLIKQAPSSKLVVAHFDHGIREDSGLDRHHVQELAAHHRLPFVFHEGRLGPKASEATARTARYDFLHKVRLAAAAHAVITAHHQDDLIETVMLNLIRGTGRRGVTSLKSTDTVVRPLLHVPKAQLMAYAQANGLKWREDPSNHDTRFTRNYIRHNLLPHLSDTQRQFLLDQVTKLHKLNDEIDSELVSVLHLRPKINALDRRWFTGLPHSVAKEVIAGWLNQLGIGYDSKTLERLVRAAKVFRPGSQTDVTGSWVLRIGKEVATLHSHRK